MTSLCPSRVTNNCELALSIASRDQLEKMSQIRRLAKELSRSCPLVPLDDPRLRQLDWTLLEATPGALAQMVLRACKVKEGSAAQNYQWSHHCKVDSMAGLVTDVPACLTIQI